MFMFVYHGFGRALAKSKLLITLNFHIKSTIYHLNSHYLNQSPIIYRLANLTRIDYDIKNWI